MVTRDGRRHMDVEPALVMPPEQLVEVRPGGSRHLMLIRLQRPLIAGETVPMAFLYANGTEIWTNYASAKEEEAGVTHRDREWQFRDFDVTRHVVGGKLKIKFDLTSDEGFEVGGWTLDDVCIVAPGGADPKFDTDEDADMAGCCSAGSGAETAFGLSLLTLGLVLRRRRFRH